MKKRNLRKWVKVVLTILYFITIVFAFILANKIGSKVDYEAEYHIYLVLNVIVYSYIIITPLPILNKIW